MNTRRVVSGRRAVSLASLGALVALSLTALPALADDEDGADGPPVARLSVLAGDVSLKRGDSGDQVAATVNAPVLGADYLATGSDGKAEVQLDGASMVRLDRNTQLRFTNLDPAHREAQLAQGTVEVREFRPGGAPQIDTPSISVRSAENARYRVDVTPDGTTVVTVRTGRAQLVTPSGTQTIEAGQSFDAQGSADSPTVQSVAYEPVDAFDRWNAERDRLLEPAVTGANFNQYDSGDELDDYGQWQNVPRYGRVWRPAEAAGWSPYHDGRWAWEDGYGWTWVAAEPWGWAPYHYGRWFYAADYGGWNWYPPAPPPPAFVYGPPPPVYAWRPALVGFFGFGFGGGGGFSLGLNFGNVGWVPLAPFETYHPWYGRGGYGGYRGYGGYNRTVVNNTTINNTTVNNITNITNINNGQITRTYSNAGAPGAIASVGTQRFLQGTYTRPVSVPAAQLATAKVGAFRGALPLAPTRDNLAFTNRPAPIIAGRPILEPQRFAGHAVPVQRVQFAEQRTPIVTALKAQHAPVEPESFTTKAFVPGQFERRAEVNAAAAVPRAIAPRTVTPGLVTRGGADPSTARTVARPVTEATTEQRPWDRFNASRGLTGNNDRHAVQSVSPAEATRPKVLYGSHPVRDDAPAADATVRRPVGGTTGSHAVAPRESTSVESGALRRPAATRTFATGVPRVAPVQHHGYRVTAPHVHHPVSAHPAESRGNVHR